MFEKRIIRYVIALAAGLLGALLLSQISVVKSFENSSFDLREQLLASGAVSEEESPIRIIYLDQPSLDWVEDNFGLGWPWYREIYGYILDYLGQAGARAVMFDVLYTESSTWGVSDDLNFASAIKNNPQAILSMVLERGDAETDTGNGPGSQVPDSILARFPEYPADIPGYDYSRVTLPAADILPAVTNLANVQLAADSDGVYRRVRLFEEYGGRAVPTLGTAAMLVDRHEFSSQDGQWLLDGGKISGMHEGSYVLRYRGPAQSFPSVNAASVLRSYLQVNVDGVEPDIKPEYFKDSYVFFGFSAPGLKDLRPVSVTGNYPGVEIHATTLDNLLHNSFIVEPSPALSILVLLVYAALAALVVYGGTRGFIFYTTMLIPIAVGFAVYPLGIWMPMVIPFLGVMITLTSGSLLNYATEGRDKRRIRSAFSQYLSPLVIQNLLADPKALQLGGEKRKLSIFFSDVQGFTTISEKLSPEELTALLNEYLTAMTNIILTEGGTIDKYEGDAIIAFWNAPVDQEDHGARMLRAALDCQLRLAAMRPDFFERIGKEMHMRIGMNSGDAVVGNMGSETRFDYTMLGDSVNLAARLEGVNKVFGTYTMVSEATRELALQGQDLLSRTAQTGAGDTGSAPRRFAFRELGKIVVVGKQLPVRVFEPYYEGDKPAELSGRFQGALELWYAGDLKQAAAGFKSLVDDYDDKPSANYLSRIQAIDRGEMPGPGDVFSGGPGGEPAQPWDGRWRMTSK